jgi:putative selenate reductase FAD-binding subunit
MTNYYRPQSLSEAFLLLNKPNTIPLAGGTYINTNIRGSFNVVDLQNLDLNKIVVNNKMIEIGSTTNLQQLCQNKHISDFFRSALKLEAPLNLRNSASLGGLLFTCDGRSPVATSLLALDARIILEPNHEEILLSDFFSFRSNFPKGSLITLIILPYDQPFSFTHVARTPFDRPIVCAALSTWTNGRTRLALGGYGIQPLLVIDGDISDDISAAARSAYSNAEDEWASAEYRAEMADVLSRRCLSIINSGS